MSNQYYNHFSHKAKLLSHQVHGAVILTLGKMGYYHLRLDINEMKDGETVVEMWDDGALVRLTEAE